MLGTFKNNYGKLEQTFTGSGHHAVDYRCIRWLKPSKGDIRVAKVDCLIKIQALGQNHILMTICLA